MKRRNARPNYSKQFFRESSRRASPRPRSEPVSRLRKTNVDRPELHWPTRLEQQENAGQDAQKGRPARPQQAKRRGVRFGTLSLPLNDARTPLADFFSILLERPIRRRKKSLQFRREPHEATQPPPQPHAHDDQTLQRSQPGGPRPR